MSSVSSQARPGQAPVEPNPHAYRVGTAVIVVLVLLLSTVVLLSYERARSIPESSGGPSVPILTRIPTLGLTIPTTPIAEQGATLEPPRDPRVAGWWSGGARPGSPSGTVVLTAHKIHGGGGAFDDLEKIERGALISLDTQLGVQNYRVVSITHYDRDQFAQQAPGMFVTDGPARLVLITCRDWNGSAWEGNTVVVAEPGLQARVT